MADEYTVGSAFAELRQMFPRGLITIEANQHDDGEPFWFIKVFAKSGGNGVLGDTLNDCMAQVKKWREGLANG